MSSASSRTGSEWERRLLAYLRSQGLRTERLRPTGVNDEGDLIVNGEVLIEAKAEARMDLPGYLRELDKEKVNYAKHRSLDPAGISGVVVIKRRLAPVGKAYVVTTLDNYFGIGKG